MDKGFWRRRIATHSVAGKLDRPSVVGFLRALVSHWFSFMSGAPAVPLGIAAVFVPNDTVKILLGLTAIICAVVASYAVWKGEREKAIELQEQLETASGAAVDKTAATRIAIKASLGNALRRGEEIRKDWKSAIPVDFDRDATEWNIATIDLISEALGDGDAHLFQDGSGVAVWADPKFPNHKTKAGIDVRMQRLAQILQRVDMAPVSPDFNRPLTIAVGDGAKFDYGEDTGRSTMWTIDKRLAVALENHDRTRSIRDCKLTLVSIEPDSDKRLPKTLAEGLVINPGDRKMIPIARYNEKRDGASTAGETTIVIAPSPINAREGFMAGLDNTLTLRATATDVPSREFRCRVWVEDGKLRIKKVA